MSHDSYEILFSGQTLDSTPLTTAKANLKALLKTNDDTIDRLFSGNEISLKKGLDREQAEKYLAALNKAGVQVRTNPSLSQTNDLSFDIPENQAQPERKPIGIEATKSVSTDLDNPYTAPAIPDYSKKAHCRQCGVQLQLTDRVCHQCGAKQMVGKPRSKVAAGLLAIFLGWIGLHRFYLGQWWGILYVLFGIAAWPIAIIEGVVFMATPEARWKERYGNVIGFGGPVAFIIGFVVLIAIIGILAAVSIPAYQDYVHRAQVQSAMPAINQTKGHLEEFMLRVNFVPNSNLDAGLPEKISDEYIRSINVKQGGKMEVTFKSENDSLDRKTIVWVPTLLSNSVDWDCSGGTLGKRYRPKECREGEYVENIPHDVALVATNDGIAEVQIPSSWRDMDLSEDANLQRANIYSEVYFVVISELKSDLPGYDLKGFADLVLENNFADVKSPVIKHLSDKPIGGMKALHYKVSGVIDGVNIVHRFAFVEGKNNFHQVIAWSLESRYRGNESDMNFAINSFKER